MIGRRDHGAPVVVVGGGLAGLTAAVGVVMAGVPVVVLEASGELGGRARSFVDETTGDQLPIGPHILMTDYVNMRHLLDVIGGGQVVWQHDEFISLVNGRRTTHMRQAPLPAPLHYVPSLIRDRSTRALDWMSNGRITLFALSLDEADIAKLDDVPAEYLLRRYGVSRRFRRQFWDFTSSAILNTPLERCSAGALLRFYRRLIGHRSYLVGFPTAGLGGMFTEPSRRFIERGPGTVRLGVAVREVVLEDGQAIGVITSGGERIDGRSVIVAVAPTELRGALGPAGAAFPDSARADELRPCPYACVYMWFDEKLTDERFWARTPVPGSLNCDFYDLSNIEPGWASGPSVIASNIIGAERVSDLSDDEIVAITRAELSEHLPQAARGRLRHARVVHVPLAIPYSEPGAQRARLRIDTPIPRLFLAGDWTRCEVPMCMESACLTGWRAAERALHDVGIERPLAVEHRDVDRSARWLGAIGRALRRSARPVPRRPGE